MVMGGSKVKGGCGKRVNVTREEWTRAYCSGYTKEQK